MDWTVPKIWEGGDVWILGGGSSVTEQFSIPIDIVEKVVNGSLPPSTYSPYMEAIHNRHVIGINVSYLIGNWIDMVFFGDNKFFLRHKERLSQWPGLKVTCHQGAGHPPWVKYLAKDLKHPRGISPYPSQVSWNANSGAAAISLAANTGAKRIILLGFDMSLGKDGKKHWHNLYKSEPLPPIEVKRRMIGKTPSLPFSRHLMGFPIIAKDAKARGIEILNASPNSAIEDFPKYSLKELLVDNT